MTSTGSGIFLNFHSNAVAPTASKAVGMSLMERCAMTTTEPAMAPMAGGALARYGTADIEGAGDLKAGGFHGGITLGFGW